MTFRPEWLALWTRTPLDSLACEVERISPRLFATGDGVYAMTIDGPPELLGFLWAASADAARAIAEHTPIPPFVDRVAHPPPVDLVGLDVPPTWFAIRHAQGVAGGLSRRARRYAERAAADMALPLGSHTFWFRGAAPAPTDHAAAIVVRLRGI